jgi:hypothetical protein
MNALCVLCLLLASQTTDVAVDTRYDQTLDAIDAGNVALADALQDGRRAQVVELVQQQQRLFRERSVLAAALSAERQQKNATLSPAAFAELRRESVFVALASVVGVGVTVPGYLQRLQHAATVELVSVLAHLLASLALIGFTVWIASAGTAALHRARVSIARRAGDRTVLTVATHVLSAAAQLLSPVVGVCAVAGLAAVFRDVADDAAVQLAITVLRCITWMRVVVALLVLAVEALAMTPLGGVSPTMLQRVRQSVLVVGRVAVAAWLVVQWCTALLDDGAVVVVVTAGASGVVVLTLVVVVVVRFRDDIAARYLQQHPAGSLAAGLAGQHGRVSGVVLVAAALVVVALRSTLEAIRRFALGFSETRRALAYVFRRQLERNAQQRPLPPAPPLPAIVVDALSDAPTEDIDELRDIAARFATDLDRLERSVTTWAAHHDRVGAAVLVGLPGYGKSTWLHCALDRLSSTKLAVTRVHLRGRLHSAPALFRTLAQALSLPASDDTLPELVDALRRRNTPQLLVVDDLQNLLLRGDPDRRVWRAFEAFIHAASPWVYVLATIDALAEQHLRWSHVDVDHVFRERFSLSPWSDADVELLLRRRLARTGFQVRYDELLVATIDGVERDTRVLATAREYARLIWDFAEGSPAVALDAWQRSLHLHDDKTLQVRLFHQPDEQFLERSTETARFVLAAVAWNENVTAEEAARGLGVARDVVVNLLERFREGGVLVCEHQRYRIATPWWSVVWRFLRRKHLITLSPATA